MAKTADKTDLLASIPLFAACSKKELSQLASLCMQTDHPEGTVLTKQGSLGKEFMVLVSGTAQAVRDDVVLEELKAGSPIGELALLDHAPRSATVTATSPVSLMVLSVSEFDAAVDSSPALARALLKSVAHRLRTVLATQAL